MNNKAVWTDVISTVNL